MHWLKSLKGRVRFKEPLSTHTTLNVGGPADVWIEPDDFEQLKMLLCRCARERLPYLVIGRGSNILASDEGYRGVVISLNSPVFTKMALQGTCISCGAGVPLAWLIRQTKIWGLGGLEFLCGIPASTAGALIMNTGSHQDCIGDLVQSITVMDKKGKVSLLTRRQLKFAYRQSNLGRYIVLEAVLKLIKRSPQEVKENIAANLARKRKTQDLTSKSAGCIFKNPIRHSRHRLTAGEMIEACGLKGLRRGGAEISAKHANFIINRNGAKARDILYLINLAQRQVKKKFGLLLKPEIRIIR